MLLPLQTLRNIERTTALSDRNTAKAEKTAAESERDSALSDRNTKSDDYDTAVSDLTKSEKAEKAIKAQTGFGFGAGAGGRGAGKGGTAKKGSKGKSDESLFRILGRNLIKELKDIKKYS